MSIIKAKQIQGVVDTTSNQQVDARKSYTKAQSFTGGKTIMVAYQNHIYWCKTVDVLEEVGNSRLSMENGRMITQSYDGKNWINI